MKHEFKDQFNSEMVEEQRQSKHDRSLENHRKTTSAREE